MTTILRLEGLDVKAGPEDIRIFFKSLHIPDGGVYIVGGRLGEAFIAFTTECDAQAASLRTGNFLKGSMVTLHVSSMEEMEEKLEESLKKQKTLHTVWKPHPSTAVNETSRPHKDSNGNVKPRSRPDVAAKTKVKPESSPQDDGAKVNVESRLYVAAKTKVKLGSRPHDDGVEVKLESRPHVAAKTKVKLESRPHDVNVAKAKLESRLHDGVEVKLESRPHDDGAKVKPESTAHDDGVKVKLESRPHDDGAKVKPESTAHDDGVKVKLESKPHDDGVKVKLESTAHDDGVKVKLESTAHVAPKTKVKLESRPHDDGVKVKLESTAHVAAKTKVKLESRPHDDGVKVKLESTAHVAAKTKVKLESTPHVAKTKVKLESTPHVAKTKVKLESRLHDDMAKVKPESTPHVAKTKVKLESTPHVAKTKVKLESRLHDDMAKVKPESTPHVAKTKVKPESRPHDIAMVKLESKPHCDSTSVSSSAAFPLDPDSADLPASNARHFQQSPTNISAKHAQPLDTSTAFFRGICNVLKGLKTRTIVPTFQFPKDDSTTLSKAVKNPEHTSDLRPGYVRLFGLPASTTKDDICRFFKALNVQEAIVNVELGIGRGCLVKFADIKDASDALGLNQQMLGSVCVEVRGADVKMWDRALQECSKAFDDWSKDKCGGFPKEGLNHERKSVSSLQIKRKSDHQVEVKPIKRTRPNADPNVSLSKTLEYTVMVKNLPRNITKTEIKEVFRCPNIPHKNVLHLLDKTSSITDTAFVIFNCAEDFDYAINLSGCHMGSGAIEVTSITKEIMRRMMAENHPRNQRTGPTDPRLQSRLRKSDPVQTERESPNKTTLRYIFIRNLPATVKKSQIRSLFCKFNLCLDDIMLLRDSEGYGAGEAVVKFECEQQAMLAQRLHGEEFLGTKVLLARINGKQVQNILMNS